MNTKLSENSRGGVFPDAETFNKIYDECLENAPSATERVKNAYSAMHDAFEEYLAATEEYMFRYAYECGYTAGKKSMEKKNVPWYLQKGGVMA